MELGFVGFGRMGGNMVKRLLGRGHKIAVYARKPYATILRASAVSSRPGLWPSAIR